MDKTRLTLLLGSFSEGGAEHMVYELARCIDKTRFDVQVLCYGFKMNTALEQCVEKICPVTWLNKGGTITPGTVWCVLKALRQLRPDVLHAHLGGAGFGAIWSILFRKPLVITAHTKPEKAFRPKAEKLVRMALITGKTKLVAVSKENEGLLRSYFGITGEQLACVNNGINLDRFTSKAHDGFSLINVARHDKNKNQAALIRCFARLHAQYPKTKLLLLGDGPTHQLLVKQVMQLDLGETVIFTGNVANTEDYYAVSDLYVQCSHREAMPLSVLEAMAAGLPVVSTHVGGLADVVKDNGILVLDNDEEALYRAIEQIYAQTPEQRDAMCRASKGIVQNYSSLGMAQAYESIYRQMQYK